MKQLHLELPLEIGGEPLMALDATVQEELVRHMAAAIEAVFRGSKSEEKADDHSD